MPADVDESISEGLSPIQAAIDLAERKSLQFHREAETSIIITADTLVVVDDHILGKPGSDHEAWKMLHLLSGRSHEVITAVQIRYQSSTDMLTSVSRVTFHPLSNETIEYYVQHFCPFDKAGAYAIQEWIGLVGVASIKGSYYNVVGLPVDLVVKALARYKQS